MADANHVPDREHVRVTGKGKILQDHHPASAVDLEAGALGEHFGKTRRDHTSRPDHRSCGDAPR